MTDHTRTEKIDGDSICFCGHPSRAGNRYDTTITVDGINQLVGNITAGACIAFTNEEIP